MQATQIASRDVLTTRMPRMLELEVFELKSEKPDFAVAPKYKNFRKEYSVWEPDELISRLRILCINSRKNLFEICAVYDEFQSR
ncbi:MAG: hypothetical protein V1936_02120 [Patescibacteria group bacterium]